MTHRWLLAACLCAAACTGGSGTEPSSRPDTAVGTTSTTSTTEPGAPPLIIDPTAHTVDALRSIDDYEALAKPGLANQSVLKFSITEFSTAPELVWLDSSFFTLHDEWYWFQLLNGSTVRGFDTEPLSPSSNFESVADAYAWADERRSSLPLDLRFTSLDRLYSPAFYDVALDGSQERRIGLGALVRVPDPEGGPDLFLIELEFSDALTAQHLEVYFDLVTASVGPPMASQIRWVPRSRAQEVLAAEIEAGNSPNRNRVVRYDDLAEPGDVEVYSPGIAAGRLLVVTEGGRWSLGDAGPDDIVAVDRAPDDLPPGNGLITGTPQTPLAHVNVLALNRGIPNAYLAGLADDPTIAQLGRVRSKVLVQTTVAGELEIIPLTDAEYDGWVNAQRRTPVSVPSVEPGALAVSISLAEITSTLPGASALDELRPIIGGKAAGFVELAAPGTTTMPSSPMVITVRPYLEHIVQFEPQLEAVLTDRDLTQSPRARFLALEGRPRFDERYTTVRDQEFADEFEADHPIGTPLGEALAAGGLVRMIRSSQIDADTLATISADVASNFADHAPAQGLRFRSSSTAEDIEGFNGAGLYDSNSGWLDPTALPDADDHKRTIERAILRTWSSYWSATAFEERSRELVDHRSGAMAVLVHARFDDPLELANGVATLTIRPDPSTAYEMVLNTQFGDTSVTNAINDDQLRPEVVRVTETNGDRTVERVAMSSLSLETDVLDDSTVLELYDQLRAVADSWLARANATLPPAQHSSTLTLDFEYRLMDAGWPERAAGTVEASRMIVKQARSLSPGLRGFSPGVLALAIPRDVLARAVSIVRVDCIVDGESFMAHSVTTDPLTSTDLGYSEQPFVVWATEPLNDPRGCDETELLSSSTRYLLDLLAGR